MKQLFLSQKTTDKKILSKVEGIMLRSGEKITLTKDQAQEYYILELRRRVLCQGEFFFWHERVTEENIVLWATGWVERFNGLPFSFNCPQFGESRIVFSPDKTLFREISGRHGMWDEIIPVTKTQILQQLNKKTYDFGWCR